MNSQMRITASIAILAFIFGILALFLHVLHRQDAVRQQHEINSLRQGQETLFTR
jgi:preprotein translocase subunit SecG